MLDNEHIQVSQVRAFELNIVRIHCLVLVVLGSEVLYSECKLSEDDAKHQFDEFKRAHQDDAQELIAQLKLRSGEVK